MRQFAVPGVIGWHVKGKQLLATDINTNLEYMLQCNVLSFVLVM